MFFNQSEPVTKLGTHVPGHGAAGVGEHVL